jgi:hypothetical protein
VRRTALPLALLALVLVSAGCGDNERAAAPPEPEPTARSADFPDAAGRTAGELEAGADKGPILAPSVSALDPGRNRFAFALYDTARKQITGAQVAVYTARRDGNGTHGPYVARLESLAVRPQFESRTTSADPDSAKSVYVTDLPSATAASARSGRSSAWTGGCCARTPSASTSAGPTAACRASVTRRSASTR